jgi:hypothetical protein
MSPVDWSDTLARLQALNSKLADVYATSVYVGSLGTSTDAVVKTTAVTIGTLRYQATNFSTGFYDPFSDEASAWDAWSDAARSCAADLNRALGSNESWDVTHVVVDVAKQAGQNLASWGGSAADAAKPAFAGLVLVLVLVLAIEVMK